MSENQPSLFILPAEPPAPEAWEQAAAEDLLCAEVVLNLPLDMGFHYIIPDALRERIQPGQRLKVPFGKGREPRIGYCVNITRPTAEILSRPLKEILSIVDPEPLVSAHLLELTRWIADRYLCGWGQVLDNVIPAGVKKQAGTRMVTFLQAAPEARAALEEKSPAGKQKLTEKQKAVLEYLLGVEKPQPQDEVIKAVGCGASPINSLRQKGMIVVTRERAQVFELPPGLEPAENDLVLEPDQQRALDAILEVLRAGEHRTALLHGVTGSGKTEVYIRAIREVVSYGRQALVLVPEISLTPQTIRRFQTRFPSVAVLHSHLAEAERHYHWQQIASGQVQVIVGARSAIFAPAPNLGVIIIDEEHETSFKQDSTPRYHAREVARRRAELLKIPLILGSATPTLESWHRARTGSDLLLSLPKRVGGRPLPPVIVVDIRHDPHIAVGASIGRALHTAIQTALQDDGQVILFLNLRGYSPVLWCRQCGAGVKCPHCDITLTWHRDQSQVCCHSCEYHTDPPTRCPTCGKPGLRYLGAGTQRLEKEVQARFPQYRSLRMDSDSMRRPGSHDRALEQFRHGEVRILLGTQMIAKGLDFPNVTLVGVVDADTMLHQPDLRASERTFHLIAQVAGRTGRSERGGRVFVQTASPGEQAILLAAEHNFPTFAEQELTNREALHTPPFRHLARVILRGEKEPLVQEAAREMAGLLRGVAARIDSPVGILGPAPAPVSKLKNLYRHHFQLSAPRVEDLRELWQAVSPALPRDKEIEFVIDVEPLNMR